MAREQLGICAEVNLHSIYLMWTVEDGAEYQLRSCIANIARYLHELSDTHSDSAFNGFIAIGANFWEVLYPHARPKELQPFPSFVRDQLSAPAQEFDLFIQLRGDRTDILHLIANDINNMLDGLAELSDEERGFRFLDNRDFTGFVDGTENPKGRNRQKVALVADEDPTFAGGSYIHVQKYVHDLKRWQKLNIKEQEDVVGRTKIENTEYSEDDKPETSHIKRTNIKDHHGNTREILRLSMPYGDLKKQGLYFISACKTPTNFTDMLESMIKNQQHDHLLLYTQAIIGASFFAPSLEFMANFEN